MIHPDDDNGDALRRLESHGDDLLRARNIDFSVVFASEEAAEEFAGVFRDRGYTANIDRSEVEESHPWDVNVVNHMVPSHPAICAFETELQEVAERFGGYNDGWGCIAQPSQHLH